MHAVLDKAARAVVIALLGLLGSVWAWAAPDLVVSGYQLQATKRLSATVYEYTYRVSATNRGTAASAVEAQVSATRSWLTPTVGGLYFGRVGAGQTVVSSELFVIRHDRRYAFTQADLTWRFVASDASFSGRFEGTATTPVASLMRNYLDDTAYAPSAVATDAAGQRVLRTDLNITLADSATVGQIQPALDAVNAVVIGSLTGRAVILVRIPDPGSLEGLTLVRNRLAAAPGIESVDLAVFPTRSLLPGNTRLQPQGVPPTLDSSVLGRFLGHHLAIRAHAAWNIESRMNRPAGGAPMVALPLLIVTDYFGNGPPADVDGFNAIYARRDYATGKLPIFEAPGGYHGYEVLGQIAAGFGGDDSPLGLFTGVLPTTDRRVVVRAVDLEQLGPGQDWHKLLLTIISESLARSIVVNSSLGAALAANVQCAPYSNCIEPEALRWIKLVRGNNQAGVSLESRFLHVVAAGNDPDTAAVNGSVFARAGVPSQLIDRRGTVRTDDDVSVPGLTNTLVVEGRYATTVALGQPPAVDCPQGATLYPDAPRGNFSPGGHISGIGSVDRGGLFVNGNLVRFAAGVYAPYTLAKRRPGANYESFATGSSLATPQVAGVAMLSWSLRPGMTPAQLKTMLVATAVRNQSSPGATPNAPAPGPDEGCPGPSGFHRTVDAYAAVLAADSPDGTLNISSPDDAPARLAMLDVAGAVNGQLNAQPDGRFTQADIQKLLIEFEARQGSLDYSRFDLNGDGRTGETYAGTSVIEKRRFDLDGNLSWTTATRPVLGLSVVHDEDLPADISVLIYYAYSPLYTGNEYERELLLLPYLTRFNPSPPTLSRLQINVTGIVSTALRMDPIELPSAAFTSVCAGGERGNYSQAVANAATAGYPGIVPTFWRPTLQAGRIADLLPNIDNCSSFIATIASSGRVWLNSAARHRDTAANKDIEYQSRFYLGEPDLAAGPAGQITPPAGRLATQALSYGVIDQPTAGFRSVANTRDFKLQAIGLR